jgi:hypothetical protein
MAGRFFDLTEDGRKVKFGAAAGRTSDELHLREAEAEALKDVVTDR